jgi:hypothetical protein
MGSTPSANAARISSKKTGCAGAQGFLDALPVQRDVVEDGQEQGGEGDCGGAVGAVRVDGHAAAQLVDPRSRRYIDQDVGRPPQILIGKLGASLGVGDDRCGGDCGDRVSRVRWAADGRVLGKVASE